MIFNNVEENPEELSERIDNEHSPDNEKSIDSLIEPSSEEKEMKQAWENAEDPNYEAESLENGTSDAAAQYGVASSSGGPEAAYGVAQPSADTGGSYRNQSPGNPGYH